ncbi:MAG: hypothetical protein ACI4HO_00360 [Ruminococcus sp.]
MCKNKKSCCFFGHKDTPDEIRSKIKEEIIKLIDKECVNTFYVGNQGNFDRLVYSVLQEVSLEYPHINYTIALAYLPKDNDEYLKDKNTLYPEGVESVPKRFAISFRNDWMINHSDFVICYISHIIGGAVNFVNKAEKQGRKIINCYNKFA